MSTLVASTSSTALPMNPRIASLEASQDPDSTSHHGRPPLKPRPTADGALVLVAQQVSSCSQQRPLPALLSPSWVPRVGAIGDNEVETRGAVRRRGGGAPAREHPRWRGGREMHRSYLGE
jgi:hypothetical protein